MAAEGVRRAEIIAILSLATDLAMGQPLGFGLRLCLASLSLASALKLSEGEREEVYYHALLRHAGCTAQTDRLVAVFGDEIALRRGVAAVDMGNASELLPAIFRQISAANSNKGTIAMIGAVVAGMLQARGTSEAVFAGQCEAAGRLAQRLGLPPAVARNLEQVYERWDGRGVPEHAVGEAVARPVRVVAVVQDALSLIELMPEGEVLEILADRAGSALDPAVTAALLNDPRFLSIGGDEAELWRAVVGRAPEAEPLTGSDLDAAIEVIADFVDLKAPQIAGHSRAVAELAMAAGRQMGIKADDMALYRAGLLHDLGYTAVPAQLRLAGSPGEQGRLHPYYGGRLLGWSDGLAAIGRIVADHHERLDGSGFHRGAHAPELSMAGRVLAAAEAYQSLIENRPFRVSLKPAQAAVRLRESVKAGELDGAAVAAVLDAAGQDSEARKPVRPAGLTAREADILKRIATGEPVKHIARQLGISPKTVGNHVQNLYAKIGVKTRAGATLFAIETGLLRPGAET